ncbi:MAG TPA: hypothetical protein PKA00_05615 [Saprospiraceae bacterium]|nr:hypothetical protein [Saprospiraceae bacterium]
MLWLVLVLWQVIYLPASISWLEWNRGFISKNYCINRDNPLLQCNGSCYIGKMIKNAMENHGQDEMPATPVEYPAFNWMMPNVALAPIVCDAVIEELIPMLEATYSPHAFLNSIFHPPESPRSV